MAISVKTAITSSSSIGGITIDGQQVDSLNLTTGWAFVDGSMIPWEMAKGAILRARCFQAIGDDIYASYDIGNSSVPSYGLFKRRRCNLCVG